MLSCFLLPYSCSAAAVSAGPLNPQSPSCAALRALKPSSCSTAAYVGQQQREVTTSRGRRRRKPALTPASGDNASRPAKRCRQQQQQLEQYPTGTRRCQPAPRPQPTSEQLIAALVSRTQLPHATAGRVVAARSKTPSIPTQPDKLCDRVQCLQQLLGTVNAELALRRCPSIVAYRCVAGRLQGQHSDQGHAAVLTSLTYTCNGRCSCGAHQHLSTCTPAPGITEDMHV